MFSEVHFQNILIGQRLIQLGSGLSEEEVEPHQS
jgi:hypothetical protein